jgi:hypothetical protein
VSAVEILNYLKRILGIIDKRLEEAGILSSSSYTEHLFIPSMVVPDTGISIPIPFTGLRIRVLVSPDSPAPVYINVDRPVTDAEYKVVFPGTGFDIPRKASIIYLKAPTGFTALVDIEIFGWSS